jgi:hypothetical protein
MKILDRWIKTVAKKDFSETIDWIEALIVGLLGILLAAFIYLDMTPLDITIPVTRIDATHFSIEQDYIDTVSAKKTVLLKNHDKVWKMTVHHREYSPPRFIIFTTREIIPNTGHKDWRLIVHQKTILEMLLKTKISEE